MLVVHDLLSPVPSRRPLGVHDLCVCARANPWLGCADADVLLITATASVVRHSICFSRTLTRENQTVYKVLCPSPPRHECVGCGDIERRVRDLALLGYV